MKKELTRLFSVLLAAVLVFGTLPVSALGTDVADPPASAVDESAVDESSAEPEEQSAVDDAAQPEEQSAEEENVAVQAANDTSYDYNIFFLDCGRKYYSVDSIKKLIDNASAAGFNYVQLAVGNDGLRLLLDDMSLTVNGKDYGSDAVKSAIHAGNEAYYNFDVDELTQVEMDEIIAYVGSKNMGVIPCVNSPGHMDAILSAASSLTGTNCAYNGSKRTIDVTNDTAVAFTQTLLQKYISYFADRGCQLFNMGADEYANDIYTTGSMGFGNLQSTRKYSYYVTYVNAVAKMIENAGMTPMAFNDGIYFKNDTSSGTFDTNIIVCYWSNGWTDYTPMSAEALAEKGFKLVNTNGSYYWVLGKSDAQCTAEKAEGFDYTAFPGGKISNPSGSMFCIWADYPDAETEESVISKTADTIAAFNGKLPGVDKLLPETLYIFSNPDGAKLKTESTTTLRANKTVNWETSNEAVASIQSADENGVSTQSAQVNAQAITVTAGEAGTATITATSGDKTATYDVTVEDPGKVSVKVAVNGTKTITVDGDLTSTDVSGIDTNVATVELTSNKTDATTSYSNALFEAEKAFDVISTANSASAVSTQNSSEVGIGFETYSESSSYYYMYRLNSEGEKEYIGLTISNDNQPVLQTVNYKSDAVVYVGKGSDNQIYVRYPWAQNQGYLRAYVYLTLNGNVLGATTSTSNRDTSKYLYLYNKTTTEAKNETEITFTGVAVGTTSVTIGGVTYNIEVTEEDLDAVTPLEIQYWITNARPTGKTSNLNHYEVTAAQAYSEEGITVADVVDAETTKDERTQEYWKTVMLDTELKNSSTSGTELQTDKNGDDETLNGSVFTKVRYWGGKWQVYTTSWVDVDRTQVSVDYTKGNNESYTYKGDKNQLVAYYMEVVNIDNAKGENELHVNAADWGTKGDGQNSWGDNPENYKHCSVSVQVVYEDSTTNPLTTTASDLKSKTIVYGYWDQGRGLGTMLFTGENNYEIYKITAETGNMTSESNSTNNTVTVTGFTWANNEEVVWGGDDQEPVASASIGNTAGNPSYEKPYDNLAWNTANYNKNNAILIRVYVKYQAKEDSLTVHYVNERTGGQFYEYSIAVTEGTYFDENFALVDKTLVGNTVVNSSGITQTVESDLQKMAAIGAEYRYSKYECVRATRDDGGKDVYLYYNFDYNLSYVVDFGTPLKLSLTDLSDNYRDNETRVTDVKVTNQTHGSAVWNDQDKTITYTPNAKFVKSADGEMLNITVYGYNPETEETGNITYTVNIYPASNVLYEENFLDNSLDTENRWKNVDPAESAKVTATQETQKVDNKTYNVFGYDVSYNASVGENGVWQASGLEVGKNTKPLTTEFYGNTFDLIGNCDKNTGRVLLLIKEKEGKDASLTIIDTRYNAGPIYQVPLAHVTMDEETTYEVKVYASGLAETTITAPNGIATMSLDNVDEATDDQIAEILDENGLTMDDVSITNVSAMDSVSAAAEIPGDAVATYAADASITHEKGDHVEIDGFRVYRSTDTVNDAVAKNYPANEQNVTYNNILDVVKGEITAYSEKNSELSIKVGQYEANGGPQNEIYLTKGQSVYFQSEKLKGQEVQVSLRAVNKSATATVTGGVHTLASNTEMYYTIKADENGRVTIANNNDGLLAIGNVKLPSGVTTADIQSASEAGDEAVIVALKAVLNTNVEPEVFTPETFTVKTTSTKVIRNKVVTLKINVSSDVAYVTINGVKYTRTGLQGMFQKTRTIRAVYTVPKNDEKTYEIIAYNADGVASEAITKTVK